MRDHFAVPRSIADFFHASNLNTRHSAQLTLNSQLSTLNSQLPYRHTRTR